MEEQTSSALSDAATLMVIGLLFALVAGVGFLAWLHYRRLVQRYSVPSSPVGLAKPGWVHLKGKVASRESLTSPVSNKRCVYLHVVLAHDNVFNKLIKAEAASRGYDLSHETGHDDSLDLTKKVERIWIEDPSGKLPVDLTHSDFELYVDRTYRTGGTAVEDQEATAIMRRLGARAGTLHAEGRYRLQETILEPGDTVMLSGTLVATGAGELVISGTRDEPIEITDQDARTQTASARTSALVSLLVTLGAAALAVWLLITAAAVSTEQRPLSGEGDLPTREGTW